MVYCPYSTSGPMDSSKKDPFRWTVYVRSNAFYGTLRLVMLPHCCAVSTFMLYARKRIAYGSPKACARPIVKLWTWNIGIHVVSKDLHHESELSNWELGVEQRSKVLLCSPLEELRFECVEKFEFQKRQKVFRILNLRPYWIFAGSKDERNCIPDILYILSENFVHLSIEESSVKACGSRSVWMTSIRRKWYLVFQVGHSLVVGSYCSFKCFSFRLKINWNVWFLREFSKQKSVDLQWKVTSVTASSGEGFRKISKNTNTFWKVVSQSWNKKSTTSVHRTFDLHGNVI